jgi:hypothetical protein
MQRVALVSDAGKAMIEHYGSRANTMTRNSMTTTTERASIVTLRIKQ